jgi:hypothetical protein
MNEIGYYGHFSGLIMNNRRLRFEIIAKFVQNF